MKLSEAIAYLENLGFECFNLGAEHDIIYFGIPEETIEPFIFNNPSIWLDMVELGFNYSGSEGLILYV